MSSSVCQGLQSCLEPEPRVLRHKLALPKSNFSPSFPWSQRPCILQQEEQQKNSHGEEEDDNKNSNSNANGCGDLGGWSFIQALSNTSHNSKEVTENEAYVHPLVKRSSSTLSTKSLEMCTESLGCETGSEISESNDEFPFLSLKLHAIQRSKSPKFSKKLHRSCSFPPPLSSISGSDGVQVRPHREGGRLVIKAVSVSSSQTYFQVHRADGRLQLALFKDSSLNCDNENDDGEEEYENVDEPEDDDEEADDHDHGDYKGNVGCEIGIGEIQRPGRCKESGGGNKAMSNWEPFWVASS